jgi:hypothetical protein
MVPLGVSVASNFFGFSYILYFTVSPFYIMAHVVQEPCTRLTLSQPMTIYRYPKVRMHATPTLGHG